MTRTRYLKLQPKHIKVDIIGQYIQSACTFLQSHKGVQSSIDSTLLVNTECQQISVPCTPLLQIRTVTLVALAAR